MHVAAIIAAGGLGTRIGATVPKQLIDLGDRTNMLSRSIDTFLRCDSVHEVVVAMPEGVALSEVAPGA
jgi:2-C-methyl-D-erythritol 4-phosphate cytidylyltransferase